MARPQNRRNSKKVRIASEQSPWIAAGELTTAQTALANDEKYLSAVEAMAAGLAVIIKVPETANMGVLRFRGINDAQSNVLDILGGSYEAAAGFEDDAALSRLVTLTTVVGLHQVPPSFPGIGNLFVRTITASNEVWHKSFNVKTYADGADDIGEVSVDLLGLDVIVIISTTLAAQGFGIDFRGV